MAERCAGKIKPSLPLMLTKSRLRTPLIERPQKQRPQPDALRRAHLLPFSGFANLQVSRGNSNKRASSLSDLVRLAVGKIRERILGMKNKKNRKNMPGWFSVVGIETEVGALGDFEIMNDNDRGWGVLLRDHLCLIEQGPIAFPMGIQIKQGSCSRDFREVLL